MVHVTAPAALPAGYTFEALVNDDPDRPFTCEVVGQDSILEHVAKNANRPSRGDDSCHVMRSMRSTY
jgi:hypothetical protein